MEETPIEIKMPEYGDFIKMDDSSKDPEDVAEIKDICNAEADR